MPDPDFQTRRAPGPDERPLLMVDIDGVVSLFGFPPHAPPAGSFHSIDGIPHFLSADAATHLPALAEIFELVWCSGWEERANEHLPSLLRLPAELPFLRFDAAVRASSRVSPPSSEETGSTRGHWKLDSIDAFAGARPLAWIDDCLDAPCREWAAARAARVAPTLLVQTEAAVGVTDEHVRELRDWAGRLAV
jgi:hypothetical protein